MRAAAAIRWRCSLVKTAITKGLIAALRGVTEITEISERSDESNWAALAAWPTGARIMMLKKMAVFIPCHFRESLWLRS